MAKRKNQVAKRLQALRDKLGQITQAELADRLGVHRQAVANWENGHRTPSPMALRLIGLLEDLNNKP